MATSLVWTGSSVFGAQPNSNAVDTAITFTKGPISPLTAESEGPLLGDCVEKVGVGSGQARVLKQLGARGALGGCHLRRHRDQLGHLAEVLGSSGEEELVFGAVWASQAQSIQLQDAFEVSK